MLNRIVWFDARDLKGSEPILQAIYNLRYEYLVIGREMSGELKIPQKIKMVVEIKSINELDGLGKNVIVYAGDSKILQAAHDSEFKTAYYRKIENQEDMNLAWQIGGENDFLIVELVDSTNIPLELLIAKLQQKSTILLKIVKTSKEAEIAFGVMEVGCNGIVLAAEDSEAITGVSRLMEKSSRGKLEFVKAKVVDIQSIGMGYRSCIDTTNLLKKNEGMIVGSTSQGGLLISSETHYLPYMELRPFRVNAGAVHSYVWAPEGATYYMTEIKGGTRLLCADTEGNTREVSVGRVKTEIRPLLKIEVEVESVRINAIVQDDWHIRIFGGDGKVRNASAIMIGDELLAYVCQGGKHVGIKIDENIEER